jgi:hypothetical protein
MDSNRARVLFGAGMAIAGALVIFFTAGGPRPAKPLPKARLPSILVADPSRAQPVTAAMAVDKTELHPGDAFELCVRARIAGGHHIYATHATRGPFTPTALTLSLPAEVEPTDDWDAPEPTRTKGGDLVYTESVVFRRHLKVQPSAKPGKLMLSGELLCQPCSEELCWPPRTIPLSVSVAVQDPRKERL